LLRRRFGSGRDSTRHAGQDLLAAAFPFSDFILALTFNRNVMRHVLMTREDWSWNIAAALFALFAFALILCRAHLAFSSAADQMGGAHGLMQRCQKVSTPFLGGVDEV
jgi:hypothetical protein